ncbi:MBL fold metallo-hydrolase [candidate division KSB1 bacterium]|nr:MBL fold metallo-hydrolase [candidate division KSB1 bacterium]
MKKTLYALGLFILPQLLLGQIMHVHKNDGTVEQFDIATIDSITFGSAAGKMTWLGHASVKIVTNDNIVIYIDPYAGDDYSEPADLILVTHGHNDHNQVSKVTKKPNCLIYSGPGANVGGSKLAPGEHAEALGISISAVHAYNSNHPKGTGVGFVLDINGILLYHAGDTSKIDEMAELTALNIDYALLCVDGIYNMSPEEAMQAAALIHPKKAIPIHVAPANASAAEKQKNIDRFNPPNKLILKEGDVIYL